MNPKINVEPFQTSCSDGVILKGSLLIPFNPKAVVQFNCGTAAKKEFYMSFLNYLAEHGYLVCLWDYRGSGESAPANLRQCRYTFLEYGTHDIPAIKDFLDQRFPDLPKLLVGHSAGGQQIGFADNMQDVIGMVGFAISSGYAPFMPLMDRMRSFFFFYMFSPVSILLTGAVRAKRFGIMEDLPRNVVRQWRAWCSKPAYFFHQRFYGKSVPKGHYANLPFPVHVFWTTDDYISNKRSVPIFWNNVSSNKSIEIEKLVASDLGEKFIGHFGFFKKRMKAHIWPKALAKLEAFLDAS